MKTVYLSLLAALIALPSHAATVVLNQAALAGLPDETVGWGFTITADPNQWILITHADFVPDPGFNPVGVFTAFITQPPNSNIVVGADSGNGEANPWTQAFDNALLTGIGSYHINDFQSLGDHVEGAIALSYDAYSRSPNDPAFDPTTDILALGQAMSAPASVTVGVASTVPEPAGWSLLFTAIGAFVAAGRRCRGVTGSDSRT